MSMKEIRNILYCHLMDIEAGVSNTWDYDVWQVKQALREAVNYFDREMEYLRKNPAK